MTDYQRNMQLEFNSFVVKPSLAIEIKGQGELFEAANYRSPEASWDDYDDDDDYEDFLRHYLNNVGA